MVPSTRELAWSSCSISAAWLLLMLLVVGLCHTARMGEVQRRQGELAEAAGEALHVVAARGTAPAARRAARPAAQEMAQAGSLAG